MQQPSTAESLDILVLVKRAQQALKDLERALNAQPSVTTAPIAQAISSDQAIEGVFDGRQLIAEDGSFHIVPENYASKSRLVEGDLLSLHAGRFKQVHRVKRKKLTATIASIDAKWGTVSAEDGIAYRVLKAPLTFFKLKRGQKISIDTPETPGAQWAAVVEPLEQTVVSDNFAYSG